MSKYIKLEDAIHNINLEVIGRKEYTGDMKANLFFALDDLPTIEISEDAISREGLLKHAYERDGAMCVSVDSIRLAPSVVPKPKEVIYGDEHNCIMTLFGECSYSETGCGDCAVVEKVRDALSKTQMKTQSSNEKPKEGEWIEDEYGIPRCSECNCINNTVYRNFCPNCGAKMKGAEK